uniref:DUF7918 domain-containing protein n=1 Tax=Mycena chlorophos TaxID=658473 RepID=A0ABQ0LXT9_MYCCL|nr:predicted protein [Mycena chlorophos]
MLVWQDTFRAWVTIDDRPMDEHCVQTSVADRTITCFVASETFSVNWVNESHRDASDGKVFVDGVLCGGKIIRKDAGLPATRRKSGLTDGLTLKRFVFSAIAIEPDPSGPANEQDTAKKRTPNPDFGLIKLVIFPVIVGEETEGGKKELPRMRCSEGAKGTITQQVQLSAVENLKKPQKISHTQKTGPPLVTFCFKYRSRDELRRLEIVPPSPSPPALKHISKPVEDSVDLALCPRPSPTRTQSIVYSPNASPSPLRPVAASQPEARVLKPKPFPLPSPTRFKLESSQDVVASSRKRAAQEDEDVIDLTLDDAPTRVESRPRKRVKHEDDGIIDLT